MTKKYILAVDQGTTSTRCLLYNEHKTLLATASREITQLYPREGFVEHDPLELYNTVIETIEEVITDTGIMVEEIAGIGITNQRETTILFDKETGLPVYNAIVWQCRRSSDICSRLIEEGLERYIRENTGLMLDPYFSATKIVWLLENVPGLRELADLGRLAFGTVDTWLLYKLSAGKYHLTDHTNASRTMLFNIRDLKWDEEILKALNIPKTILPEVKESSGYFGFAKVFGQEIPILSMVGDQQGALFGQGCIDPGSCKITYGTGAFLLLNTGKKIVLSSDSLLSTIGISFGGEVSYAIEGSVFIAGALMKWLKEELGLFSDYKEIEVLANEVEDSLGVVIVPAFSGLGAPYWHSETRGSIFGLTRGVNKRHIIRAGLEAVALQVNALIESIGRDCDLELKDIKVDGGMAGNTLFLELQSALLKKRIIRTESCELTAYGAYLLAGLAAGFWSDRAGLFTNRSSHQVIETESNEFWRNDLIRAWDKAVKATISYSKSN